jgi:F420-dependent oxidoreductase-like protein
VDLGVHVASFSWPEGNTGTAGTLADIARTADDGGFYSVSVMDHLFQMDQHWPAEEPMLEGYTTLGYLAGITSKAQLRLLVTGVTYRYPGLLAKAATTVDVLSGGRGELGIGAAWYEREHVGLGIPYPPLAERFERLEEAIQICLQMWSDDNGEYKGTHYQLAETLNSPQPISQPHPPIMIGGGGEKKTLRLVAKYAQACNLFATTPEEVTHKLDVLRGHCEDEGTNYDAIRKTCLYVGGSVMARDYEAFLEEMTAFGAAGIQETQIMPLGPDPVGVVSELADQVVGPLGEI